MALVKIKHLGGADSWAHPTTGQVVKAGAVIEADAHTQSLVDDGWAEPVGLSVVPSPDGEAVSSVAGTGADDGQESRPDHHQETVADDLDGEPSDDGQTGYAVVQTTRKRGRK